MIYLANDKYSAVLTAGYSVGQSTLYVSAVPDNVPTVIVAAKGTDKETVFQVTSKTTNSLTGVSRLRGANVDLDAQTPLTCLNNEEFINQFERATGAEVDTGTDPAKIVTPKAIADSKLSYIDGTETLTNKTLTNPTINFTDKTISTNVGARAYLSTEQTISHETGTIVNLDREEYDLGGDFDTTNHKFVTPVAGYYLMTGAITIKHGTAVAGETYQLILCNLTASSRYTRVNNHSSSTDGITVVATAIKYLAAGAEIAMNAYQTSGTTCTLASVSYDTFLCVHLLSI